MWWSVRCRSVRPLVPAAAPVFQAVLVSTDTDHMNVRHCPRCDRDLPLNTLDFRDSGRTRLRSYCRDCAKSAWRDWYSKDEHRQRHHQLVGERRRARANRHRGIVRALKRQPCADCGKTCPAEAMDFDHLWAKRLDTSRLPHVSGTVTMLEGVEKCEVVCANCHRIRTKHRLVESLKLHENESESG